MRGLVISLCGVLALALCGVVALNQNAIGQAARHDPPAPTDKAVSWTMAEMKDVRTGISGE